MSQRVFLGGGPEGLLAFRACFGVGALLDRGLGPPGFVSPAALLLHVFCECFAIDR